MQTIKIIKKAVVSFVVVAAFLLQPVQSFGQTSVSVNKSNSYSISSNSKNGVKTYHIKNKFQNFKIEYEGDITVSKDDKDIEAISRGGFIEIKKSSFGTKRRIVIHAEGGKLVKKYFVGWSEKSYNPEGKKWLAEILPEILRTTTIGAEARVDRFYKKGGVNAVVSEVGKIKSDYVKSAYLKLLLNKDLNTNGLVKVLETAGKQIKSDHYVSQILKSNQKAFLKNDKTISAYIKATESIKSDHYVSQVLKTVIKDATISDKQLGSLLEVTKTISSDHYLSGVLKEIMDSRTLNATNINKIIELSRSMKSDHYKTEVLKKALKTKSLSSKGYASFLASLSDIKSDHYISSVINEMLKNTKLDTTSLTSLLKVMEGHIQSDHYITTIFKKLAKSSKSLSEPQVILILDTASKSINSSHYLTTVLVAFSDKVNSSSEKVKSAYRKAAKAIKSDTYYGRVMKALD